MSDNGDEEMQYVMLRLTRNDNVDIYLKRESFLLKAFKDGQFDVNEAISASKVRARATWKNGYHWGIGRDRRESPSLLIFPVDALVLPKPDTCYVLGK